MELATRDFGDIEINKEKIVNFPKGIPGFLDSKQFVFLPLKNDSPFIIMQSVKEKNLAFITVEPGDFIENYQFEIDSETENLLKIKDINDVTVFNIVTVRGGLKNATVNLAAPLIVNFWENIGKQIILDEDKFAVQFPLFTKGKQVEKVIE